MKFEINRGNELIRRGESIVYNWIFSIEGPRNLYRDGGGARVPGIPNRPYFSIPLWKSENTPIPQRKSWNEPRRHRVIGASILDVTQGRLPSRRLKEEALDPEGYLRIDGRKLNWKPRGAGRHADFHVHFYGGKIIFFVISIWKRCSIRYGVVSKNLRRGRGDLSVDRDTKIWIFYSMKEVQNVKLIISTKYICTRKFQISHSNIKILEKKYPSIQTR